MKIADLEKLGISKNRIILLMRYYRGYKVIHGVNGKEAKTFLLIPNRFRHPSRYSCITVLGINEEKKERDGG